MLGARNLIAHIDVVRPYPGGEQSLHQQLHDLRVVVHALEEHGLAAQRYPRICEHAERRDRGGRQLVGVVEMRVDVERVVLLEDGAQLRRDALGEVTGDPAADSQHFEMRNGPQPLADIVDAAVR